VSQQAFPVTFANLPGGNNPAALLDQNFAVCVRGPTPTVVGTVPYWDNTGGTSLNAGYATNPGFGTISALVGLDGSSRLPAVNGSLLTNIPSGLIRSYLAGMTLSNDGVTPNTILDISAGVCADSTQAVMISSATAFTKTTGGAWTSGTGNAGMGLGLTIAINTWYHVFAINNGGNADFYFDTSVTAANKPVGTTAFRRIGSFKTDGSAHILGFVQVYDEFLWTAPINELNTASVPTIATLLTLVGAPTGVQVEALLRVQINNNGAGTAGVLFQSPDETSAVAGATIGNSDMGGDAGSVSISQVTGRTDTSARLRWSASAANVLAFGVTRGWRDFLGRNA
jgi:hypothetical protein